MGNLRSPQRRRHDPFASPTSFLLSNRPFAPTVSQPSSSLHPKDQLASPVQAKGFGYSFEHMAAHHPEPATIEAEPVPSEQTTNSSPHQLATDTELLPEQEQPQPTAHGDAALTPTSPSALQRMKVPTSKPIASPPPTNRQSGTKRSGWSIERMAITYNYPPPAQLTAANDAPTTQESSPQTEVLQQQPAESALPRENTTGLPDNLKTGIESLSGLSLDDVHVHYNSSKPAQVDALAYTQGAEIHVGPGQEQHLAHEAWHVVQQKQGRVQPTVQAKGVAINDDVGLEREADVMGARVVRNEATTERSLSSVPSSKQAPIQGVFSVVRTVFDSTAVVDKYKDNILKFWPKNWNPGDQNEVLNVLRAWANSPESLGRSKSYFELLKSARAAQRQAATADLQPVAPGVIKIGLVDNSVYDPTAHGPETKVARLEALRRIASLESLRNDDGNSQIPNFRDTGRSAILTATNDPGLRYTIGHTSNFLLGNLAESTYEGLFEQAKILSGLTNSQLATRLIASLQNNPVAFQGLPADSLPYLVKISALFQGPELRRAAINPTAVIAALNGVVATNNDIITTLQAEVLFVASGGSLRSQYHRTGIDPQDTGFAAIAVKEYENIIRLAEVNDIDINDEASLITFVQLVTRNGIDALTSQFTIVTS
jgi:hypothetical protein